MELKRGIKTERGAKTGKRPCQAHQRWQLNVCQRHISSQNQRSLMIHHTPPQPFYGPFSGTSRVSRSEKRISGLHGARED